MNDKMIERIIFSLTLRTHKKWDLILNASY